jgi:hypothetical protein
VGGGVSRGEGIERVDAAEEDLKGLRKMLLKLVYVRTHGFGVDVEMVLVVVDIPERSLTGVRDVA